METAHWYALIFFYSNSIRYVRWFDVVFRKANSVDKIIQYYNSKEKKI